MSFYKLKHIFELANENNQSQVVYRIQRIITWTEEPTFETAQHEPDSRTVPVYTAPKYKSMICRNFN